MGRLPRLASNWGATTWSRRRTWTRPLPLQRGSPAPNTAASKCGPSGRLRLRCGRARALLACTQPVGHERRQSAMNVSVADRALEEVFRREAGRVLATLIRLL